MYQYDDPSCVSALPTPAAAGTAGYFTNGNPASGLEATLLTADFMNMLMMELINVVEAAGLTPSKTTYNQVLTAIQAIRKQAIILSDTGTANTYAAVNATPLTAGTLGNGTSQTVQFQHANTGASTYAPDGLAAKPIYGLNLTALQGGEIAAGGIGDMIYVVNAAINSGNGAWILWRCTGGALQVAPATAGNQAAQLGQVQTNAASYAVATGTANAHTIALTPALTARTDGMPIRYKAPAANTGAVTLADGVGTANVIGANHAALQGGEYLANGDALVVWNSTINGGTYILLECTGGALQVAPATASQHAVQFGQVAGVVGSVRNLVMSVTTASATATLTADEIIVETALGGLRYCLPSFNKTINLGTTGAGGMDTGTATANGWLGVYAIYNPTSGASALLGHMESGAALPSIYGGANMPSGYTASAFVAVVPISATAGQFAASLVQDRQVSIIPTTITSGSTTATSESTTSVTITGIPFSAIFVSGTMGFTSTASTNGQMGLTTSGAGNNLGAQGYSATTSGATGGGASFSNLQLPSPRTIYYYVFGSTGSSTINYSFTASSYRF